jgi:glycosyltransferase involved in cell wall biosynthesis
LREEYEKWGLYPRLPNARIVEKELREYEMADYISIPSTFAMRTFLSKGFPQAKLLKTSLGVDLSEFQPQPKRDTVFRVVFAGRLDLRKGVQYLLQAFAELKLRDAELWLIGSRFDELAPFLDEYRGSYIHIDHVPQAKLRDHYSQCSVFVLPSIEDGFGIVLPQAMACGLPVVCTINTAGEDLVTNGVEGFVIPVRDIAALKDKLLYLYENPDIRAEMGASALRRVATGLTWDDIGQQVCRQYSRILQERGCF